MRSAQQTTGIRLFTRITLAAALVVAGLFSLPAAAQAADKVKVGVFPVSSSLPYFIALDLGYFKELNIEPETITLMGGPPNVAALITNQIEVSVVLVTLEGLNANVKKPGVAMYIAMNGQNATPPDGAVRRALRPRRQGQVARGLQGPEADVGAGAGEPEHRQGHSRQGRAEGRRLHHRSARHGPAHQRHEGRHLRRRLYARAERHA